VARILSEQLSTSWGQNIVVDNRPGANGITGTAVVAKAAADGYTIGLVLATHAINPLLYREMPFDTNRDFAPITLIAEYPLLLVVNPAFPAATLHDFIERARTQPGKITFASSGNGSGPHLAIELLKAKAGIDLLHVPYKGGGLAITDVVAGHVNAFFSSLLTAQAMVQANRLRVLAVTSRERSSVLPNVPAISEIVPGFSVTGWLGLIAPAGTPAPVIAKIQTSVSKLTGDSAVRDKLAAEGAEPRRSTPKEFAAFLVSERDKFAAIIKAGNLKLD
jgi:tripartite-type tricarboxylate transporter receptor subunit TctC